jgi:hypothetical protein
LSLITFNVIKHFLPMLLMGISKWLATVVRDALSGRTLSFPEPVRNFGTSF